MSDDELIGILKRAIAFIDLCHFRVELIEEAEIDDDTVKWLNNNSFLYEDDAIAVLDAIRRHQ